MNFKHLLNIFFSYILFLLIIAIFGKGYSALESLMITLSATFFSILFNIFNFQKLFFKKIDYILIVGIFVIQSSIGIFHFLEIINPFYFSSNSLGVDLNSETYYWDLAYFVHILNAIAEFRIEEGYFNFYPQNRFTHYSLPFDGGHHKNYILGFIISDLFYFGDAYFLNFMAINILSIFFAGLILALIASKLFNNISNNKLRLIFYLCILQPLAWIPSHSMRDIFGAFIIILSVALILFSSGKLQKIVFSAISLFLVFQHRAAYSVSILGAAVLNNFNERKYNIKIIVGFATLTICIISFVFFTELGQELKAFVTKKFSTSLLFDTSSHPFIYFAKHILKIIIGPFPWTQYFDGSTEGYSAFYSSIYLFQAAWHLTIMYFLMIMFKKIFSSKKLINYFLIILLFAIPAIFSWGGMNIYLLPSLMLGLVFLQNISANRLLKGFIFSICIYISTSSIYYIIQNL